MKEKWSQSSNSDTMTSSLSNGDLPFSPEEISSLGLARITITTCKKRELLRKTSLTVRTTEASWINMGLTTQSSSRNLATSEDFSIEKRPITKTTEAQRVSEQSLQWLYLNLSFLYILEVEHIDLELLSLNIRCLLMKVCPSFFHLKNFCFSRSCIL